MKTMKKDDWYDRFIVNNGDLLDLAKKVVGEKHYAKIREIYKVKPNSENGQLAVYETDSFKKFYMSEKYHRTLSTQSANLARAVIENGGTNKEIVTALTWMYICMDVGKYRLDWKEYRDSHNIKLLEKKYRHK